MEDFIQINKFSHLYNGKDIFFCKTDYLGGCFKYISTLDYPVTLITGNSDYSITNDIFNAAPKNISRWFAQNCEVENEAMVPIPMGLENSIQCKLEGHGHVWEHAKEKPRKLSDAKIKNASKKIYANFSVNTHHSRNEVAKICNSLNFVTCELSENHSTINNKSYEHYVSSIVDHEMIVCPRGNGIDCHRIWEVLYLGRIPIVKKETAINSFTDLPIIFLDGWEQLSDLSLIEQKYNLVKNNSLERAYFSYWKNRILV